MNEKSPFLKACWLEDTDYTPIWLMRQAGRYMKEYRAIRSKTDFLTMCKTPELAAEVTLQPIDVLGVDAAIIFADILLPLEPMGMKLEFAKNEGPVLHNPVRASKDVDSLRSINTAEELSFLPEAIKLVKKELKDKVPLIGFSGAPFTLASYMIEGGSSRNYLIAKKMMYNEPEMWHRLMDKIADVVINYLLAQINAGVDAIQLFDSWVGCLSPHDYQQYALPHSKKVLDIIGKEGIPIIHFGANTSTILHLMREAGGDVIGMDWRVNLDDGWKKIGHDKAVQGNLDPTILFSTPSEIKKRVKDILDRANGRPGHIFNLGHGILPETPVENVIALIKITHELSSK